MNASASAFSFIMFVLFLVFALLAIPIASIWAGDGSQRCATLGARPGGERQEWPLPHQGQLKTGATLIRLWLLLC